jgi:hypothetical protein
MGSGAIKWFQDPVYGAMPVRDPLLLSLIDSHAVQRLRRVRQLGVGHLTFLGAEHSRFAHSLGAMHLMATVLGHLELREGLKVPPRERQAALAAALLHDIGHSAFSHTLESVLGLRHEAMSVRLVREEPELKRLLGPRAALVAGLIAGGARGRHAALLHDLLSSQLDVDRLDYLARDAHATGVSSGRVDLPRIYSMFTVCRGRLAVHAKGQLAVEEYFLARYFMYWKVYYHKTSRGFELMLRSLLDRARDLHRAGELAPGATPALQALLEQGGRMPVAAFMDHDDSDLMVAIKAWQQGGDALLAGLCRRFLGRGRFKLLHEAATPGAGLGASQLARARGYFEQRQAGSARHLLLVDRFGALPYDPGQPVLLVGAKGRREELSSRSELIRGVMAKTSLERVYCPPEDAPRLSKLLGLAPPAQLKLKLLTR